MRSNDHCGCRIVSLTCQVIVGNLVQFAAEGTPIRRMRPAANHQTRVVHHRRIFSRRTCIPVVPARIQHTVHINLGSTRLTHDHNVMPRQEVRILKFCRKQYVVVVGLGVHLQGDLAGVGPEILEGDRRIVRGRAQYVARQVRTIPLHHEFNGKRPNNLVAAADPDPIRPSGMVRGIARRRVNSAAKGRIRRVNRRRARHKLSEIPRDLFRGKVARTFVKRVVRHRIGRHDTHAIARQRRYRHHRQRSHVRLHTARILGVGRYTTVVRIGIRNLHIGDGQGVRSGPGDIAGVAQVHAILLPLIGNRRVAHGRYGKLDRIALKGRHTVRLVRER